MAWLSRNRYRIDVWLIDYDGTRLSSTGVYVATTVPFADVEAFAFAYAERIYAACNAGIHKITIRAFNYWAPHEQPLSASLVQRCGVFIMTTDVPDNRALVWVPSIDESLLLTTPPWAGVKIDQEQQAVADLVSFLIAGDGTVQVCSPERELLTEVSAAYYQWRDARLVNHSRRFRTWG